MQFEKGLLHRVLGVADVTEVMETDRLQPVAEPAVELLERRCLPRRTRPGDAVVLLTRRARRRGNGREGGGGSGRAEHLVVGHRRVQSGKVRPERLEG
jgi:hypothetical protein